MNTNTNQGKKMGDKKTGKSVTDNTSEKNNSRAVKKSPAKK